ncbi:hypothetical protein GOODEAATRI_001454, partial [Goodea atripinnis]
CFTLKFSPLLPDDFMLLLCASLQRQVFDDENKAAVRIMAGDNVEICRDLDAASFSVHNPVPDFIHCRYSSLPSVRIIWDSICFAFLLLQRRVFMSYYFLHVVADIRASQILASRYSKKPQLARSVRQQKFKRGKEKMLSLAQESAGGQTPVRPEEEDDDDAYVATSHADNIIKRVFNIIKFTWVLFQTTVESFTSWMNDMCREYIDISTVLRIERCMLTREVKKGNVPSRESIHVYYEKAMKLNISRQASMDQLSEDGSISGSTKGRKRRRGYPMDSQDSTASRDSISRYPERHAG